MTYPTFLSGYRLISGDDLNTLVQTLSGAANAAGVVPPAGSIAATNVTVGGYVFESANVGLTAASGGQSGALQLSAEVNQLSTVAAGNGVALPTAVKGLTIFVVNNGANPVQVFGNYNGGSFGDTIDGVATGTGITQMVGSMSIYTCIASSVAGVSAGMWVSEGVGTGYAGGLQTFCNTNNVSAAGTTQATATQLTTMVANVTTVAAGTGVNLPASAAGLEITVINNGANPLQVYPLQGSSDTINGIAAATGVSLIPGATATFNCTAAGAWTVQAYSSQTAASTTVASASSVTLTAALIAAATSDTHVTITGSTAVTTLTTDTAANIVKALHNPSVGTSYKLRIINVTSTTTSALTGGTNVTVSSPGGGVLTIPATGWRDFIVKVTAVGTPAVTMQSTSTGTWS